ncbi:MFS transporter [Chloroflexota bacterium]
MAGRFTTGIFIDRIGNKSAAVMCFSLLILTLLWLQWAQDLWMFYLFAVVYGLAHGGIYTVVSPIVVEYFGIRSHGVLLGIVAFSGTAGGAIGSVIAGYIFDVTASYSLAFWISVAVAAIGLGLISSLRQTRQDA